MMLMEMADEVSDYVIRLTSGNPELVDQAITNFSLLVKEFVQAKTQIKTMQ
jgi:hypothetical protein